VILGAAAGLGSAALLERIAASMLSGIGRFEPSAYAAAAVLMAVCAASAGYLAAWRIRRISPADALRSG
jgi:ABC-type antimicrobial peptide transport system permease subunit